MARDVDSLVLCMKALLCDELFSLDPSIPPMPFREEVSGVSEEGEAEIFSTMDSTTLGLQ